MDGLTAMASDVPGAEPKLSAVIATSFGCPYEGPVDPGCVMDLAGRLAEAVLSWAPHPTGRRSSRGG